MKNKSLLPIIVSTYIGNMVELFDFVLCGLLLSIFGDIFFPPSMSGFFSGAIVYFMGALLRPFGGVVIGKLGDTYGRKLGIFVSVAGMGIATLGLAFLPTYESIGIASCIGFILLRFLQSFCMGGESPGAVIFLMEHLKSVGRTKLGGIFATSNGAAFIAAASAAYFVHSSDSPNETWRYAFIVGGMFAGIAFFIRFFLDETPDFLELKNQKDYPFIKIISDFKYPLILGVIFFSYGGALTYFNASFIPRYIQEYLQLAGNDVFLFSIASQIITLVCIFICAVWIQKRNITKKAAYLSFWMGAILPIPIATGLIYGSDYLKVISAFSFLIPLSIGASTFYHLSVEIFPASKRCLLVALSLNIGVGVFGGMQPMINSWLIEATGIIIMPALFIAILSVVFLIILNISKVKECFWKEEESGNKIKELKEAA